MKNQIDFNPTARITRLTERLIQLIDKASEMTDDKIGDEFTLIVERLAYNVGKLTDEDKRSGYTLDYETTIGAAVRTAVRAAKEAL